MATADTGPADPLEATPTQSHASVVANSAIIVFREGLEAVLIFAAVTASFLGAHRHRRRPVVAGAATAFGASVLTWFVVQALLDVASPLGPRLEAITGFLAIAVLLVVLNWLVHRVYWSEWIGRHHRHLLARTGFTATAGLVALGFTSVYRECFEVVLFLQNLELKAGPGTVLEGVLIGLAATAAVGVAVFWLHQRLPYRRMLVLTGVLVGVQASLVRGGDEAVHAIENVDHELVPPAAHLAAVATAPGDDEPAQMLVFVLRSPAGVAAHGHRLTLSQTPAALARLGVGRRAT